MRVQDTSDIGTATRSPGIKPKQETQSEPGDVAPLAGLFRADEPREEPIEPSSVTEEVSSRPKEVSPPAVPPHPAGVTPVAPAEGELQTSADQVCTDYARMYFFQ